MAGSYDNEGIAIFCMLLTYALWVKSVKTGSLFWGTLCSLAYFYMVSGCGITLPLILIPSPPQVSSWGGYVFLINLIPMHVLALMITGRFSHRIYVAYCTVSGVTRVGVFSIVPFHSTQVYCLGTILSMQISFVGFQPVQSSEHMAV